jgi:4-hydroxy-3-polyprenylbenzoate decarboxylase
MNKQLPNRLIVAITGASGAIYGVRLLEGLSQSGIETHLILSDAAKITLKTETDYSVSQVQRLASVVHHSKDIGASISSGSFDTRGMIIAPCSTRTLSEISSGVTTSLVSRAADVVLKERRRLVLLLRETPLHLGHLRSMVNVTEMGAIVMPPVPAFYHRPTSLDEVIAHTVNRCLDLFNVAPSSMFRWAGLGERPSLRGEKEDE